MHHIQRFIPTHSLEGLRTVFFLFLLSCKYNHGEATVIGRDHISECNPKKSQPCKDTHKNLQNSTDLSARSACSRMWMIELSFCSVGANKNTQNDMNGAIVFNPLWVFVCSSEAKALSVEQWGCCPSHVKSEVSAQYHSFRNQVLFLYMNISSCCRGLDR